MMELKQLQYFVTIVEQGTISSAARILHMTQPPLSFAMKQLEEDLGTQLFERGNRRIRLTREGEILYHYALELLALEKTTISAIQTKQNDIQPPIRLGLISSFESDIFYTHLHVFLKQYPQTSFQITEANTYDLLELLNKGNLDMAVIRTPYQAADLDTMCLSKDHLVAVGNDAFETILSKKLSLDQLSHVPLIIYRRWERVIREEYARLNLNPVFLCVNDDARTSIQWARRGLGIALVPDSVTGLFPDLMMTRLSGMKFESELRLVRYVNHEMSEHAKIFFESFKQGA